MIQVKSIAYLALKSNAGCHWILTCNLRNIVITVCTILEPTIDMFLRYRGFASHLLKQRTDISELTG